MTTDDDLHEGLRRIAAQLDAATDPVDPESARRRRPAGSPRRPAQLLLAAAAVAVLVAGAAMVVTARRDGESVQTDVPSSSGSTSTTEGGTSSTSTRPGPASTSLPPETPVDIAAAYEGTPLDQLPDGGLAFVEDGRVTLATWDGEDLGTFPADLLNGLGSEAAQRLVVQTGFGLAALESQVIEEADGCLAHGRGAVRVAACGPEQGELALLDPNGGRTAVAGFPLAAPVGRWRWADPSPDGRWLLAQWSSECEVPTAMFVRPDGSGVRTVDGSSSISDAPTSGAVGWTPDGRAVVLFPESACGLADEEPGIYAIDPDTGDAELLRPGGEVGVGEWVNAGSSNDLERQVAEALTAMGAEPCCGEPSHGSASVSTGMVVDGREVAVGGVPFGDGVPPLGVPLTATEVDGFPAAVGTSDGRPLLAFTCGGTRWVLSAWPAGEAPATADDLATAAARLIPYLHCTVGDPPLS